MKTYHELKPESIIHRAYGKSKNFVTPDIDSYGWIRPGRVAYELSSGESIFRRGELIWGLSIAEKDTTLGAKRLETISKCFSTKEEALDYVRTLSK